MLYYFSGPKPYGEAWVPAFCFNDEYQAIQQCSMYWNDGVVTACRDSQTKFVPCYCETDGLFNVCSDVIQMGLRNRLGPLKDFHWKYCFENSQLLDCATGSPPVEKEFERPFALGDKYQTLKEALDEVEEIVFDGTDPKDYPQKVYDPSIYTEMDFPGPKFFKVFYRDDRYWQSDPCLLYYSPGVCARCKIGIIGGQLFKLYRIVTAQGVSCGTINQDENGESTCQITMADASKSQWSFYEFINEPSYYAYKPIRYANITTGLYETVCYNKLFLLYSMNSAEQNCEEIDELFNPTGNPSPEPEFASADFWLKKGTIGCTKCYDSSYQYTFYNRITGFYVSDCITYPEDWQTREYLPNCNEFGYVQKLEGLIPSEQTMVCVDSRSVIPNCIFASSNTTCNMCELNYNPTQLLNSFNQTSTVCLHKFCGVYGKGHDCSNPCTIKNCRKCYTTYDFPNRKLIEQCQICNVGFYRKANVNEGISATTGAPEKSIIYACDGKFQSSQAQSYSAQKGAIELDVFVKSTNQQLEFTQSELQRVIKNRGHTVDEPFFFIQHALYESQYNLDSGVGLFDPLSQSRIDPTTYQNVTVNVWLFKGVHHFIQCEGRLQDARITSDQFNPLTYKHTDCSLRRFQRPMAEHDNVMYYFRPLYCSELLGKFSDLTHYGSRYEFLENCVDIKKDPKPQIRIPTELSLFNVTNFMRFENIAFTGEDLLMNRNLTSNLHNIPVVKCTIDIEPTGAFAPLNITTQISGLDVFQQCSQPIDVSANLPPRKQKPCSPLQQETTPQSTNRCSGELYHEDFFKQNKDGDYFYRHKVLFNLYSFDKVRSNKTHAPTLELVDCEFKYFIGAHTALIQVETNNMGILGVDPNQQIDPEAVQQGPDFSTGFYGFYGEDRGAQIRISNSTFAHSSFCRGLIFTKARLDLAEQTNSQLNFFNFTVYGPERPGGDFNPNDSRTKSFILLENSVFRNLAQSYVLKSLATAGTIITNPGPQRGPGNAIVTGYATLNQGLILNVQGYNGTIEVRNCTIDRNMAYINNIYNPRQSTIFEYREGSTIKNTLFYRNQEVYFNACLDQQWAYLNQYYSNPFTPFNDEYHYLSFESISAINIRNQLGAIIIVNNTFTDNIGSLGGAINIDSMLFTNSATQASLVIKKNTFQRNMAYFGGNAFHVGLSLRMTKAKTDAEQLCGAAILIEDNFFEHNIGTKQHHGGAGLIKCVIQSVATITNSGIQLEPLNKQLADPLSYTGRDYDNPLNTTRNVTDIANPAIKYQLLKYGTQIRNNRFVQNFAGMQGTALKLENINELQVLGNVFQENGPVTSLQERLYSPYYNIIVKGEFTVTFSNWTVACTNELSYYHQCNNRGYVFANPPVQGALYIYNCHEASSCFGAASDAFLFKKSLNKTEAQMLEDWFKRPFIYQHTSVTDNVFKNNQANLVLFEQQTLKQASSLFLKGGKNVLVSKNQFLAHVSLVGTSVKHYAYDLYSYFGPEYFASAQAPIAVVQYAYNEMQKSDSPNTTQPYGLYKTAFHSNQFKYNTHYQTLTVPSLAYHGSLLVYQSNITTSRLEFSQNYIGFNRMIGPGSALIHIEGGILNATANLFEKNGYVSTSLLSGHPDEVYFEYPKNYVNWLPYTIAIAQDMGLFYFEQTHRSMPFDQAHWIQDNTFTLTFCVSGCVYSLGGIKHQQFAFVANRYSFIVASDGVGAVSSSKRLKLKSDQTSDQLMIQVYTGETFEHIYGGTISVQEELDTMVTIVKDSVFNNSFGDEGGAISVQNGGILLVKNSTFQMNEAYLDDHLLQNVTALTEQVSHNGEDEPSLTAIFDIIGLLDNHQDSETDQQIWLPKTADLLANFSSFAFPAIHFISDSVLASLEKINNKSGQIRYESHNSITSFTQPIIAEGGISLSRFCQDQMSFDPDKWRHSAIVDSQFRNLFGQTYSAIAIYAGEVSILETEGAAVSFTRNIGMTGSPLFSSKAELTLKNVRMFYNYGQEGACLLVNNSRLQILNALFRSNKANHGGVIFAVAQSQVFIDQSNFFENLAYDGSVLFSVANNKAGSLQLTKSTFRKNYSYLNMFNLSLTQMQIANCEFTDNFAFYVNHGFSVLLNSQLEVTSSIIQFSQGVKLNSLFNQSMYGVFLVMLQSTLSLRDKTEINNVQWGSEAAVSVQAQSSLFLDKGVTFRENRGINLGTQTIGLHNTRDVTIQNTVFEGSSQDDILFENSRLIIRNSQFTRGAGSHMKGQSSSLEMAQTSFFNSSDAQSQGHAFLCGNCFDVLINQCVFSNLAASVGAALMLKECANLSVLNSTFADNTATGLGGAIYLLKPMQTKITNCTFVNNSATSNELQQSDKVGSAGAIYFECKAPKIGQCDVELANNLFTNNTALFAGGALRAVNQNFTTASQPTKRLLSDQLTDSNVYSGNSAFYGSDFASRPDRLEFSLYDPQNEDSSLDVDAGYIKIAPGQSFQFTVKILDTEGRVYSIAHGIEATVEIIKTDQLHPNALIQANKVLSNHGVFTFTNLNIKIPVETEAQVVIKILNLETFTNPVSFIDVPLNMTVFARNCRSGESYQSTLACVPCSEPFYSYKVLESNKQCNSCPEEAQCFGRNNTAPKKGYWRSNATSDLYTKCRNFDACLGGNREHPLGVCDTGYQGILCAECTHGNYKMDEFLCATCAGKTTTVFFTVCFAVALVVITGLLVRSAIRGRGRLNLGQCFAKIIVNHYQMLIILQIIDFKLPDRVYQIIKFQNKIASIPLRVFNLDCLLMHTVIGPNSKVRLNYFNSVLYCTLPYAIAIFTLVFWLIVGRTCRKSTPRTLLISYQFCTFYIVTLLFYPSLTRMVVEGFNCIEIEGVSRLYKDLEQECWKGTHLKAVKWMFIPTLVIWVLGFPIATLIMLKHDKEKMRQITEENGIMTQEDRQVAEFAFLVKWGFLLSGFSPERYYWEVVMMLEKAILVLLVVMMSPLSASVQALLMVLMLCVFLVLQETQNPFISQQLNNMQKYSILVLITIIYFGLYFLQDDQVFKEQTQWIKWLFFVLILVPTLVFMGAFIASVRFEVLKALKSVPTLSAIFLLNTHKETPETEVIESISKASEQQGSQQDEPDLLIRHYVQPTGLTNINMHGNLYDGNDSVTSESAPEIIESVEESDESGEVPPDKSETTADNNEIMFRVNYVASKERDDAIDTELFRINQRRQYVSNPIVEATVEDSVDDSGAEPSYPQPDNRLLQPQSLPTQQVQTESQQSLKSSQSQIPADPLQSSKQSKHSQSPSSHNSSSEDKRHLDDESLSEEEIITTTLVPPRHNRKDFGLRAIESKKNSDTESLSSSKPTANSRHSPQMHFHDIIFRQQRASLLDQDNGLQNMRKQNQIDKSSSEEPSDDEHDVHSYQSLPGMRNRVLHVTEGQFQQHQPGRMTTDDRGQVQNQLLRMMPRELERITEGLGSSPSASRQTTEQQSDSNRKRKQPTQAKPDVHQPANLSASLFVPQGRHWNQARNQVISSRSPIAQRRLPSSSSSEEEKKQPGPNVVVQTLGEAFETEIQLQERTERAESMSGSYQTKKSKVSVRFQENSFGVLSSSDSDFDLL